MSRISKVLVGMATASIACVSQTQSPPNDSVDLDEMKAEIEALIANPVCTNVNDCRTAAFGEKPCGGPWEYLVYSITEADSLELARRIHEYNAAQAEDNRKRGIVSDCMVVMPPTLGCTNNLCTAIP